VADPAAIHGATSRTPGIVRRLAGMLYESLLLVGVFATLVLLPQVIYAINFGQTAARAILLGHSLAVLAAYFTWFWCHGGQTLAMKTWKIRLINARNDGAVTVPQALLRFALCWPSLCFFGVGLIWALFDRERQFMHDRLAGTRLISAVPPTTSSPSLPAGKSH